MNTRSDNVSPSETRDFWGDSERLVRPTLDEHRNVRRRRLTGWMIETQCLSRMARSGRSHRVRDVERIDLRSTERI